jgi:hypothetical protein
MEQLFLGPAAGFPSLGGQMDHCVGGKAVSGRRRWFSFVSWPNGPLCRWKSCFWAPQLVFLHRVAKWTTVLVEQLFLSPKTGFPSSVGQMDHCVGGTAGYGPRSWFSFIGWQNGPLCRWNSWLWAPKLVFHRWVANWTTV